MAPSLRAALLLSAWSLAGCPGAREREPEQACRRAYDKCMLPTGVLGICDTVACAPGAMEPCLVCRSQH
jgi:hypothetical protein